MFVVTGLHSKRRPCTRAVKFSATIRKQGIEKPSLPLTISHTNRYAQRLNISVPPSATTAPRVSGPRMVPHHSDRDTWNRNCKGGQTIKVSFGRVTPPRVRKFIPKPLILVERMKAHQLFLETCPTDISKSRLAPGPMTRSEAVTTTPVSTHATPPIRRMLTCSTLSSDSSGSISFLLSSRNKAVSGTGFWMHRAVRPLSLVTMGDTSACTDTFVADSPCCAQRASSKLPLLVMTADTTQVHSDVESYLEEHDTAYTTPSVLSGVGDFVHTSCYLSDAFEPPKTSTPLSSNQAEPHDNQSPMAFVTSALCPTCLPKQTFSNGNTGSFEITSPTSRVVYPFNSSKSPYVVKLPNSGPATSISGRTRPVSSSGATKSQAWLTESGSLGATPATIPRPSFDLKRPSTRTTSPSPTLVLDGVFALPRPLPLPPSSSPLQPRTLDGGFARPRKPTSRRRPPSETTNAPTSASLPKPLSASTVSPRGRSSAGLESSPRSKLARVLTAHASAHPPVSPQTQTQTRTQVAAMAIGGRKPARALVPPLVEGVLASTDPQTQCEIEGLRARRAVGLGRGTGTEKGVIECMSLASVGVVAKLRARWEAGSGSAAR